MGFVGFLHNPTALTEFFGWNAGLDFQWAVAP